MKRILFLLINILAFCSCKKQQELQPVTEYNQQTSGVFICNEGNFTYGNASLSYFDLEKNQVHNQVFYNANNVPLGDVCQSMAIKDSLGFVVINNSGKVYVINTRTFKYVATIDGLVSPRYIEFIDDNKAYLSDLYDTKITVFNPNTFTIIGKVNIGRPVEKMLLHDGKVYASSWSYSNKLYQIDAKKDKVLDSLELAFQPNGIVLDKNEKLWVLSNGGYNGSEGQETAALTRINPVDFSIEKVFTFPALEDSPGSLSINTGGDSLFFLNHGLCVMSVNASSLPTSTLIPENNRLFYGFGIDPVTSTIYISDAVDYLQKGAVFRFRPDGTPIDSFRVDIIPSEFTFKTEIEQQ